MKIPGLGEVSKNEAIWIGILGTGVVGIAYYRYRQNKNTATNAQGAATGNTDYVNSNAIDPTTGLPYPDESPAYYGYGGLDPSTGVPYVDETGLNSNNNVSNYTSNVQWTNAAIMEAETLGIPAATAQAAISAYLQNSPQGLPASQYTVIQEILALVGPPPQGSFTLSEQPSLPTGGSTTSSTQGRFNPQLTPELQGLVTPVSEKPVAAQPFNVRNM